MKQHSLPWHRGFAMSGGKSRCCLVNKANSFMRSQFLCFKDKSYWFSLTFLCLCYLILISKHIHTCYNFTQWTERHVDISLDYSLQCTERLAMLVRLFNHNIPLTLFISCKGFDGWHRYNHMFHHLIACLRGCKHRTADIYHFYDRVELTVVPYVIVILQ